MSLDNLSDSETDVLDGIRDSTIQELVDEYNEEIVRRGVEYMASLERADKNFRDVTEEDMEKGYEKAGVDGDTSDASAKWAEEAGSEGIGIDDE